MLSISTLSILSYHFRSRYNIVSVFLLGDGVEFYFFGGDADPFTQPTACFFGASHTHTH